MHHVTEDLAHRTQQQQHFWNQRVDATQVDHNNNSLCLQLLNQQPVISQLDTSSKRKSSLLKVNKNLQEDTTSIELSENDFESIPESIRGRCKLEHVISVAIFIHREVAHKYAEGFRGKFLHIERQQIIKYCGEFAGLYSVIMNTSLWREIVSTLSYLDFLKIDKDGLIIMNNFKELR